MEITARSPNANEKKIAKSMETLIRFTSHNKATVNDQKIKDWRKNHLKNKEETQTIEAWSTMRIRFCNLKEIYQKFQDEFNLPADLASMVHNWDPIEPYSYFPTTPITPKRPLGSATNTVDSITTTPSTSRESIAMSSTSASIESIPKVIAPTVDETKKYRDIYRRHKKLFSHMHVVKLHIECQSVPSTLARNRFPPCPFPHDINLTKTFNDTIRACQEKLLLETQNHIEESLAMVKCMMAELTIDDSIKATIQGEVDWEMRDVAGKALDRAEGQITQVFTPKRSGSFKRRRHNNKEN